jgi:hypothetical protein
VIIFGSVFIKKSNQTEIFFEKKPKPGQTDRFRFGFLGKKPVQTSLARFCRFWLGFSSLARFWLSLARFFFWFFVGFGSVRFGLVFFL